MLTPASNAILRYDLAMRREDWDQVANEEQYIGMKVMPPAPVAKPSSAFTRITIKSLMPAPEDLRRGPRGAYKRDEFGWDTDNYTTEERGFESAVDDAEVELYGDYLPVEQISASRVTSKLLAEHEQAVATAAFDSGHYTGAQNINLTVGGTGVNASFQDISQCLPVSVINKAKWQLRTYGVRANALVISQIGFDWLTQCADIIGRIKYSGKDDPKNITSDMFKALFGLKYIFVGDGYKNSAGDGATPSLVRFWDPTMALVCRVAEADSMLSSPQVSLGRTVMFTGQNASIPGVGSDSMEPAIIMEEYREEQRRGGVIRGRWNWEIKPFDDPMDDGTFFRAGVLITNITDGNLI